MARAGAGFMLRALSFELTSMKDYLAKLFIQLLLKHAWDLNCYIQTVIDTECENNICWDKHGLEVSFDSWLLLLYHVVILWVKFCFFLHVFKILVYWFFNVNCFNVDKSFWVNTEYVDGKWIIFFLKNQVFTVLWDLDRCSIIFCLIVERNLFY